MPEVRVPCKKIDNGLTFSAPHDRGEVVDYRVVLLLARGESIETIRVYDSAHGYNEMHRFTRGGGKQTGKPFHTVALGKDSGLPLKTQSEITC